MDQGNFEALMERLMSERRRLDKLRSDYAAITRSRFHALRMLWFSLKGLIGRISGRDRFAMWSQSLPVGTGLEVQAVLSGEPAVSVAERRLIEVWAGRAGTDLCAEDPIVTVVIPVYNNREVTVRCLQSIADTWFETLKVQVVVVDDGSSDGTAQVISRLVGADCVRSGKNEGFIRACNRGAAVARGKYICFLNNDTEVRAAWLDHLASTIASDETIGIAGSKLIFPDGRLQEAGGIMWRDATGWNYGRFESPADPRYNFVRDVDYVSGAALMIRAGLFRQLGGFTEELRPAYYEDTDLCFGVRSLGYRVVYQPLSEVIHYEGLTSGSEASGAKRFQEINRPKFRLKWAAELRQHFENDHANVFSGARRIRRGQVLLVVDSFVPLYDREAGSNRMFQILKLLRAQEYSIIFLPDNYAGLQPYTQELQQMGIEVLHHIECGRSAEEALNSVLPTLDFAWISRPELFEKYGPLIARNAATQLIYDTVDLHFVRKRREAALLGGSDAEWLEWQRRELEAASRADATVVVTADEKEVLEELGVRGVHVVPTIHDVQVEGERDFHATSGLLFIGNYHHEPNVDAVTWLCNAVMPLVWGRLPTLTLTLAGSDPPDAVLALGSGRVRVPGYAPDVAPYFRRSRIFVAPLRFGAGMKGKIGQAFSYALPVVTTPIGAEGLGLRHRESALVVPAEAQAFAEAITALHADEALWRCLSTAGPKALGPFTPPAVGPLLKELMTDLMERKKEAGRGHAVSYGSV